MCGHPLPHPGAPQLPCLQLPAAARVKFCCGPTHPTLNHPQRLATLHRHSPTNALPSCPTSVKPLGREPPPPGAPAMEFAPIKLRTTPGAPRWSLYLRSGRARPGPPLIRAQREYVGWACVGWVLGSALPVSADFWRKRTEKSPLSRWRTSCLGRKSSKKPKEEQGFGLCQGSALPIR